MREPTVLVMGGGVSGMSTAHELAEQFWPDHDLRARADGTVSGVLSVDVSEWEAAGELTGKHAQSCSRDEFVAEVRHQLRARGFTESRCGVWPLSEPLLFAPARLANRLLFSMGRPAAAGGPVPSLASLSAG